MLKKHSKKIYDIRNLENQRKIESLENEKKDLDKKLLENQYNYENFKKEINIENKEQIEKKISENLYGKIRLNKKISEIISLIGYFQKDMNEQALLVFEFENEKILKIEKKLSEKESELKFFEDEKNQLEKKHEMELIKIQTETNLRIKVLENQFENCINENTQLKNLNIIKEKEKMDFENNIEDLKFELNQCKGEKYSASNSIDSLSKKVEKLNEKNAINEKIYKEKILENEMQIKTFENDKNILLKKLAENAKENRLLKEEVKQMRIVNEQLKTN